MTGIFGGKQIKAPAPTPAPPPPTIDDAAVSIRAEQDARDLRRRRGRAATVLSLSENAQPVTANKQLLGS